MDEPQPGRPMWKLAATLFMACPAFAAGLPGVCVGDSVFALALHGGAVWGNAPHTVQEAFLGDQLRVGRERLAQGDRAIDVVEAMVVAMEDSGLYNAGKGSTANRAGEIEMDAAIMDGRGLEAGAVAGVRRLRNPVAAARLVRERTPHVLMAGSAAEAHLLSLGAAEATPDWFLHAGVAFPDLVLPADWPRPGGAPPFAGAWAGVLGGRLNHALILGAEPEAVIAMGINADLGLERAETLRLQPRQLNDYLIVETGGFRIAYRAAAGRLEARLVTPAGEAVEGLLRPRPDLLRRGGTVGAVARDRCGDLAAASSTGGFGSKLPGRVGDTPLIGAGTYADNRTAAISTTGHGEYFIRHTIAAQIAGRLRFGGETLAEALRHVIFDELGAVGGDGGVIAVDATGRVEMAFNTDGMVRGWTTDRLPPETMTGAYAP